MTKLQLKIQLSQLCSEKGISLPADLGSLTVAGLKERIGIVRGMVTEPASPLPPEDQEQSVPSTKARNAQDFASRYATFVQRLRQNRTDKQAAAAILAAPKFIARLTGCTVTTQGPRMFVHDHGKRVPLEDTNLQW